MISSTKKASTTKKISIMDHPEYRKQWDLLMGIRTRITEAEARLNEIVDKQRDLPERIKEAQAQALEETIQGGDPRFFDLARNLREQAEEIRSRLRGLRTAEAEQHRRVNSTQIKASAEICKELKPLDRELAHAEALLFIKWCEQKILRIDFLNELDAGQVYYTHDFVPMAVHYGDARQADSGAASLIMEYVDRGYLQPDDVPAEWRKRWRNFKGFTLRAVNV